MSIYSKHFSRFLHNFKTIYEYKHMEKVDLGKHCLLLIKLGFPRWRHNLLWCFFQPGVNSPQAGVSQTVVPIAPWFYSWHPENPSAAARGRCRCYDWHVGMEWREWRQCYRRRPLTHQPFIHKSDTLMQYRQGESKYTRQFSEQFIRWKTS